MLDREIHVVRRRRYKPKHIMPVKGPKRSNVRRFAWHVSGIDANGQPFAFSVTGLGVEDANRKVSKHFGVSPEVYFVSGKVVSMRNNLQWSLARFQHVHVLFTPPQPTRLPLIPSPAPQRNAVPDRIPYVENPNVRDIQDCLERLGCSSGNAFEAARTLNFSAQRLPEGDRTWYGYRIRWEHRIIGRMTSVDYYVETRIVAMSFERIMEVA